MMQKLYFDKKGIDLNNSLLQSQKQLINQFGTFPLEYRSDAADDVSVSEI